MAIGLKLLCAVGLACGFVAQVHAQAGRMITMDNSTARNIFELNIQTGQQTQVGTVPFANAAGLALDCSTGNLYVASTTTDGLYSMNTSTYQTSLIGTFSDTTVVMHGLEWDSSTGMLYGGSSGKIYRINPANAVVTLVGDTGLGTSFVNLGYHPPSDTLYATYSTTDSLYTINRSTGLATLVGPLNGPTNPHGLTWNKDNNTMYLICSNTDTLYTVDLQSGSTSPIGALSAGNYLCLQYLSNTPGCGGSTPCLADFNATDGLTPQDIFDFLNAWFSSDPRADFNAQNGITPQDIFDFLNAWFAGC